MKKKVLIGSIVIALLAAVLIGYFAVSSSSEPTVIPPTPSATPSEPTVIPPTPSAMPEDNGRVIEITAAELISQLSSNPTRYREGTKMRVSGVVVDTTIKSTYIAAGPLNGGEWTINCEFNFQPGDLIPALMNVPRGTKIVVEGKFSGVGQKTKTIFLENSFLISRE